MAAVLGIDLGTKRIGLAIATAGVATPAGVIARTGDDAADIESIRRAADERDADMVVLGHPRRLDGTTGPAAEAAELFADALRSAGMNVVLWDERLSTVQAERVMIGAGVRGRQRRKSIDALAATVILQSYIDTVGWKP